MDEIAEAMKRHPAGSGKNKLKLSSVVTYNCCDHCGINFYMDSNCEKHPNAHTVPCMEPGCLLGTTASNF